MRRLTLVLVLTALVGCGDDAPAPVPGPRLGMAFTSDDFYAAPLPSDHRLVDGLVDLSGFPNPDDIDFVSGSLALLDGQAAGFGASSGIFFTSEAPIDASSLPSLAGSLEPDASAFVVGIDPDAPDYLQRYPVEAHFEADGGPFGAANMLSLLPLQGVPFRPGTSYAAFVTSAVRATDGRNLSPAVELEALRAGQDAGLAPAALETYAKALAAATALGIEPVAVAAFTTWDPVADMHTLAAHARSQATPTPTQAWALTDTFDSFCVYETQVEMPVYQDGEPPYFDGGGAIDLSGELSVDHLEAARIIVTVPRTSAPSGGWPVAMMVRTGGGGDRPLVDRGVRDADGNVLVPGSGPAVQFTAAGFAGVSVDGPHGGIRNVTGGDEQLLIFNVNNPVALMNNIRQSALELALVPDIVDTLAIDVSDCTGAVGNDGTEVTFDVSRLAMLGHSMGATIGPLTLAVEPRFGAVILSGAGGSWIENIVHKLSPLEVKPLAEGLIGYKAYDRELHEHDAVLSLLQWAGEVADPPLYAPGLVAGDRHVLMLQGIVDTYILPPIANATSLSFGLDLAGPSLDVDHPELTAFDPLQDMLAYSGRGQVSYPVQGNHDGVTAVVVQHGEDGVEDGHEVVFQTDAPKHQYRCFLESYRAGTPIVPEGGELDASCP